jgi:dynein heavy chain
VEAEAASCRERLSLASRLVGGLQSEKLRWGKELETLGERQQSIVGDVLLASSFVSYCGPFPSDIREVLWRETWIADLQDRDIAVNPGMRPLGILADDAMLATWQTEGLPSDSASLENGAIVCVCKRWPLLIDPQLQVRRSLPL